MKINARALAIAATLAALAAGWWWLSRPVAPEAVANGKQRHDPDYIVENFHSTIMSADGKPQTELYGKLLRHYGDDDSSDIDEPYVIQYAPGQAPTHARAQTGYLPKLADFIRLDGNVLVAHGHDPRGAGAEIHARQFTLKLDKPTRR